jgi:hypothetical protein
MNEKHKRLSISERRRIDTAQGADVLFQTPSVIRPQEPVPKKAEEPEELRVKTTIYPTKGKLQQLEFLKVRLSGERDKRVKKMDLFDEAIDLLLEKYSNP